MNDERLHILIPVLSKFLFSTLSTTELKEILPLMDCHIKKYDKKEIIISKGNKLNSLGLILTGSVNLVDINVDGKKTIISSYQEEDLIFSSYYVLNKEASVDFICSIDAEILWFKPLKILQNSSLAMSNNLKILKCLLDAVSQENISLLKRNTNFFKKSSEQKVLAYIAELAANKQKNNFQLPFNRQDLADYLGIDRSSLSRTLNKLKNDHLIDFKKGFIEIIDADFLENK